jgi:hypothetical protein
VKARLRPATAALLFALVCLAVLAFSSRSLGLCWDETIYFEHANVLRLWAKAGFPADRASLYAVWHWKPYYNPHPPFLKVLSALSSALSPAAPYPLGFRLGYFAFSSACLALCFSLLALGFGTASALGGTLFALLQPRVFLQLLMGTDDGPVAVAWLALALLSWRIAEGRGRGRALWAAFFLVHAAATATKLTGFLAVLPVLLFHALRRDRRAFLLAGASCVSALAFFLLLAPADWPHPGGAIWSFVSYPWTRERFISVATFYLGRIYGEHLPWHAFFVLSAATVPPAILLLAPAAPLAWKRPENRGLLRALLPFLAFWVVIGLYPGAPKHDGVRQFVAFYPLLGLLAWMGARGLAPFGPPRMAWLVPAAALLGSFTALYAIHPFEESYYNFLVGGLPGAEDAGFEMAYDFCAFDRSALDWLNRELPKGASISILPNWEPHLLAYQAQGLLRSDLRIPVQAGAQGDALVLLHRKSMVPEEIYETAAADFERKVEGVSLLKIARRRGTISPPHER